MMEFEFLSDIPIDASHTLDQLTGRFQSVKDGLPELIKNSKDQYSRLSVADRDQRQILVLVNSRTKSLAVLDFAGATSKDLSGWKTWSSRTPDRDHVAVDIEAGHGNGGKAFMVRGSNAESFIESCFRGRRTRMAFRNDDPEWRYFPAYIKEGGRRIQDKPETDPIRKLNHVLDSFGLQSNDLPKQSRDVLANRQSYTVVVVEGVRDWEGRWSTTVRKLIADIPGDLANHGQAALTVETCSVWAMVDGELVTPEPLSVEYPDSLPGLEHIDPMVLPDELVDPRTHEPVATGAGDKVLCLRTSQRQLRMSDATRALNIIRVRNDRNVVGHWPVGSLATRAGSAFIYGELKLPAMAGAHLAGADRVGFADTPLVRAVEEWVAQQVDDLARKIERAIAKETRPEERSHANETLDEFRKLMRQYLNLEAAFGNDGGRRQGGPGPGPIITPPKVEWGHRVDKIVLEDGRTGIAFALGSRVPLDYRCYQQTEKGLLPVRGAALDLVWQSPGVVEMNTDGVIAGISAGTTTVWLRDRATGTVSNEVTVEVVECTSVDLLGPDDPLLQGQRVEILYSFKTDRGNRDDLLIEGSVDEPGIGKLNRNGFFTAGYSEGTGTIRVKYGPKPLDHEVLTLAIGSDVMPRRGHGSSGDIPLVLMCGTEAPGMGDYPPDQRTHLGGERYPTIIEEPQFPSVVWLNPESTEALRVRRRGGPTGMSGVDTATFLQFLALKCFEILKRLKVRQGLGDVPVTERDFSRRLAEAEMECAGFIDAAYDLALALKQNNKEGAA